MTCNTHAVRPFACAAAVAFALGFAACGDSSDDDGGSGGTAATEAPVSDEQAVRQTLERLHKALYAGDGKTYCAGATTRLQTALVSRIEPGSKKPCAQAIKALVPQKFTPAQVAQYKPKVVSVKVTGDRASVKARGADGSIDRIVFVKQSDEWKLDDNERAAASQ